MFYCRTFLHYSQAWHILHGNRCHICRLISQYGFVQYDLEGFDFGDFVFFRFFGAEAKLQIHWIRIQTLINVDFWGVYNNLSLLEHFISNSHKNFQYSFPSFVKAWHGRPFFFLAQSQFSAMKLDPINIQKIVNKFIVILIQCHSEKWTMYILKVRQMKNDMESKYLAKKYIQLILIYNLSKKKKGNIHMKYATFTHEH